ncbi:DUF6868 family protein [Gimesia sp.]|uniref:DUF6868 family protein n=1 Tax=Gimesia sp. TaxID=2024833 RepID=UPI000C61B49D|nr:hypothetical protein [Gimesia sp.]MAX40322.1 hypothetical protein [Gimesia sp.]HAH47210.1 hypothetical protein [Planctomycetaceae bacterium]HBL42512.1 hypothetical protein [Planctomycetaceae bacterium]|tara:strand:+ start:15328 stop:15570 length:243 start_codon:yes stop_codon:yes gene_type:complete
MDLQTLTAFFMWCTIVNGSILIVWTLIFLLAPDLVYRSQHAWIPLPRESFNVIMYCFIGLFKLLFLVFNAVPYLALLLIG